MRVARFAVVLGLAGVLGVLSATAAEDKGWVSLFDGKSLAGWTVQSGTAKYHVEDGAIVGTTVVGSPNTFLCTNKDYGDFILEFEVKVDPRLNSGVQIRSHMYEKETEVPMANPAKAVKPKAEPAGANSGKGKAKPGKAKAKAKPARKRTWPAGRVYGYQVEISNEQSGTSGGIYDEARRGWLNNIVDNPTASKAFKDNEWNKYRIECRGNSIKTFVNGVPCADLTDSTDASGLIGLQVHGTKIEEPLEVRWRNLRIQELGAK